MAAFCFKHTKGASHSFQKKILTLFFLDSLQKRNVDDVKSTASSLSRAHPLYRALLLSREARGRPVPPLLLHHRCEDRYSSACGGLRRPNLIGLWPSSARDHGFGYSWPLLPLYLGCTWKRAAHGAHYPSPWVASGGKNLRVYRLADGATLAICDFLCGFASKIWQHNLICSGFRKVFGPPFASKKKVHTPKQIILNIYKSKYIIDLKLGIFASKKEDEQTEKISHTDNKLFIILFWCKFKPRQVIKKIQKTCEFWATLHHNYYKTNTPSMHKGWLRLFKFWMYLDIK
jgi:hypothetical protein